MRRYDCVWAVALVLGLAPGCLSVNRADLAPAKAARPRPTATQQVAASPYHPTRAIPHLKGPPLDQARLPAPLGPDQPVHQALALESAAPLPPPLQPAEGPAAPLKAVPPEEPPLVAALRCYMEKRPAEAVVWLERYDKQNQELLLSLLPLAARLTQEDVRQASPREVAALLAQLDSLATPLRPLAGLTIGKMHFCRSIEKFGVYDPLPDDYVFRPGEPVQVYVELRNFVSEPRGHKYVTRLSSSVAVHDYQGKVWWREKFNGEKEPDESQSPRHDYFNNYCFRLPYNLAQGRYTLWIAVEDLATKRPAARRSLDFRVGPPG